MVTVKTEKYIGAIDQGTTGTKFIIFDGRGNQVSSAYREHEQIYPHPGWVEHDPEEIWENVQMVVKDALADLGLDKEDLLGIGITNQRETSFIWDKEGKPLSNAIVWQDRRTAERCAELKKSGQESIIQNKTGLKVDPYFSGTKYEWLINYLGEEGTPIKRGETFLGTAESWLIWKLTGGKRYITDYTNASRTLLFNIEELKWDENLLHLFGIPEEILPEPLPNIGPYGEIRTLDFLKGTPIGAAFGDQQSALFGQGCFKSGEAKNTYGTGSFLLVNIGEKPFFGDKLLTTIAFNLNKKVKYALEGSIYSTGATIQWLRDGLGVIEEAAESEQLARDLEDNQGVYMVPAFSGLGAPYWDPTARGTILGLTRGSDKRHLARAALESIAYQVEDVLQVIKEESNIELHKLKIDGGAAKNDFLCQFQSDISDLPVLRTEISEATALGAAYGAGLALGLWKDLGELRELAKKRKGVEFIPKVAKDQRLKLYKNWRRAVLRAKDWAVE